MGHAERRGAEKTIFQDSETGRTIWRLTNSQREDKHTYYDICPWSPAQKYLLFSSTEANELKPLAGHDTLATTKGIVYLMDTSTYAIRPLVSGAFYNTHTGVFSTWHPNKPQVFFSQAPDRVGVVNVNTGKVERILEGSLRQLSPDGKVIAWEVNEAGYREGRGIYTMNEDGSNAKRIISTEELYELLPNKNEFPVSAMTVGNTKWTPDGRYMLVTEWTLGLPKLRRSLYVVSRDGRERRWLCYFGHHHSWTPDGKQVLFCDWKGHDSSGLRQDPRLFLINFDGSDLRVVIEEPLDGHPVMDPSGRMIVTWDERSVLVVHMAEQKVERLATLKPAFDQSHRGTHPHPVWSPDGKQIVYNSAQSGHSQLYLIPMS